MDRPNILILMTDQQRADCLSCAGHPQVRTPNMDRIAAEGARFTRAATASPLCMPARASFLCGRHVHAHGIWGNTGEVACDDDTLFRSLRDAGYYTGHVGKSHYYGPGPETHLREREDYMHALGFDFVHETTGPWGAAGMGSNVTDYWQSKGLFEAFREDYRRRRAEGRETSLWASPLSSDDHLDGYIGRQAARFIEEYDRAEPFALFVGFGGPHPAWDPPAPYATMYDPHETPPPEPPQPAEPGPWVPEAAAAWQRGGSLAGLPVDAVRRLRAAYYGKITHIDAWVGRILDACEGRGLLDDTLVVFWSDHGEMAGDHGVLHKSCFFESSLRMPLMVRWSGRVRPGLTSGALAQTVDIMPTVLEAAGAAVPARCQGRSLWPVLDDPSAALRPVALSEVADRGRRNTMVCTERYKFAAHETGEGYLLYDLARDPRELNNLIGHPDCADIEAEMRRLLADCFPGAGRWRAPLK